jgi:hypothetical protein
LWLAAAYRYMSFGATAATPPLPGSMRDVTGGQRYTH